MTSPAGIESPFGARDLATLREILLSQDRARLEALQQELEALREQTGSAERVLDLIQPLLTSALAERARTHPAELAEAIRPALVVGLQKQVAEERESFIALLTPIIGRTVQQAIAEALESLARQIDARMQRVVNVGTLWRRARARLRGVDEGVLLMREALPWQPKHAFLIHSSSGLVLAQRDAGHAFQDSDLVAALLTAIRSFARESFRGDEDDSLHQIRYGEQLILLEEGAHVYLALVGEGVPPADISQQMRDQLAAARFNQPLLLRDFRGDPGADELLGSYLMPLLQAVQPEETRPPLAGLAVLFSGLLVLLLGCGWLGYRLSPRVLAHLAPTAVLYVAPPPATATLTATPPPLPTATPLPPSPTASHTPTLSPTPTRSPTSTPSATPSATPSLTPTPAPTATAAPITAVMTGSVYIRPAPDPTTELSGEAVLRGDTVRVVERQDPWVHVVYPAAGAPEIDGWVPLRWLSFNP